MKTIILAGGCFWGVEAYFKQLDYVVDTHVGYIDGTFKPTYQEVCAGSGHTEAVLITYKVDYLLQLLKHFFNIIDPTSINKQGPDIGIQYRSGIYNYSDDEYRLIKDYILKQQQYYNKPIVIQCKQGLIFYDAEEYHQDYLDKNKQGYCHIDLRSVKNVK